MKQEIVELRKLMAAEGIDAYYVPSGAREFMSNLTGEAGDMIVT